MKKNVKTILMVFLAITYIATTANAQAVSKKKANKATQEWKYEIEGAGVGVQGTYQVKVWSYSKKKNVAIEQCKKNAVHGIIFKGFTANEKIKSGQKPLAKNPSLEAEKAGFFKDFFADGGKYMKFVISSTDEASELVKVGKEYKSAVIVSVNVAELRKDLEAAGIIRGLSNGF
jgi:hypothetical protein